MKYKHKYKIMIQFAKNDLIFDDAAKADIDNAVRHYNRKSLIARNPKQITDYSFSEDNSTMEVILESEAELPMPSKALRLLSTFLVEQTSLKQCVLNKQLFKMVSENVGDTVARDNSCMDDRIINTQEESEIMANDNNSMDDRIIRLQEKFEIRNQIEREYRTKLAEIDMIISGILNGKL